MQAVVPVAGKGTRLRPLTDDRPKALVSVAGQPLLTHVFAIPLLDPAAQSWTRAAALGTRVEYLPSLTCCPS